MAPSKAPTTGGSSSTPAKRQSSGPTPKAKKPKSNAPVRESAVDSILGSDADDGDEHGIPGDEVAEKSESWESEMVSILDSRFDELISIAKDMIEGIRETNALLRQVLDKMNKNGRVSPRDICATCRC